MAGPQPQEGVVKPTLTKSSVNFRTGTDRRQCATCVMFHPRSHSCDLVKGMIRPDAVCDRWEKK